MKIAILISDVHGGGAESTARRWAQGLTEAGHEVDFMVFKPEISNRAVEIGRATVTRLVTSRSLRRHPQLLWRLAATVRAGRPDVILTMNYYASIAALSLRFSRAITVPVVVSERNLLSLVHAERGFRQDVLRVLARRLYRRAAGLVAISFPVAGDLLGSCRIDPSLISVVPNPVLDHPAPNPSAPSGQVRVAFVGRIEAQKRPLLFVEALAAIAARGADVSGVVIGTGSLQGEMEAAATRLGVELDFLGWREPWTSDLPTVDCLLLPSAYEGFGNVLVEAAAAGIPSVAAADSLGVADAIVPGVTGEIAWSSDPGDLAESVIRAVVAGTPGAAGLEPWFSRFSRDNSVELLARALARAVN